MKKMDGFLERLVEADGPVSETTWTSLHAKLQFAQDLERLFQNQSAPFDTIVRVNDGATIDVHKVILALSRTRSFRDEWLTGGEMIVEGPPEIVRHLVNFLYSGTLPAPENFSSIALELVFVVFESHLRHLKDFWQLNWLCLLCARLQITPLNVVDVYLRALATGCEKLVRLCRPIVKDNMSSLGEDSLAKLEAQPKALIRLLKDDDASDENIRFDETSVASDESESEDSSDDSTHEA